MTPARSFLAASILLVVAFGPFLHGSFVWDDAALIEHNPAMRAHDQLAAVLTRDLWGQATGKSSQLYHPIPMLTVWLQAAISGLQVWPMRLFNVLLHALVVTLFVRVLLRLELPRVLALSTGLVVLVHPTVTEPVMWITGRHDLLAMAAVLGALLAWPPDTIPTRLRPGRALACGLLMAAALLCKEPYVVAPALLLVYVCTQAAREARWPDRAEQALFGLALVPLGAALLLRHLLKISLGSTQLAVPLFEHARSFAGIVRHYGLQLLSLGNGPTLAPYVALDDRSALGVWACLIGVSGGLSYLAWRVRGAFIATCLGWAWFLIALAPHVISVPTIGMYGNRYAYCALFGLALCIAALLSIAATRLKNAKVRSMMPSAALALCMILALRTGEQASHWVDNRTLYSADLQRDPSNGYAMYHLGTAVLTAGGCKQALDLFVQATKLAPGYQRGWHNVAGCLIELGRGREAVAFAERAVALAPGNARAHYNLGVALASSHDTERSLQQLQRALELDPGYAPARAALANTPSVRRSPP